MKPLAKQPRLGFTLIEILVALVIVALIGVSSQQRVGQFIDDRQRIIDRQESHWYAWNQLMLQYQEAKNFRPNNQKKPAKSGHDMFMGRDWYFQTEQKPTLSDNFFRFEVEVFDQAIDAVDLAQSQHNTSRLVMFLVL